MSKRRLRKLCVTRRVAVLELLRWKAPRYAPARFFSAPEHTPPGSWLRAAEIARKFKVPEDQRNKFSNRPIIVPPMGEYPAECIPKSGPGFVKCTQERSFTHKVFHKTSKQEISVPPSRVTQQTWSQDVPYGLQDEAKAVRDKLFGNWIDNMEPEEYRMRWDAITPNQD
ncbi:hypothetical protein FQN52_002054 [Onygenales sp. PD_12]|nr:hypothetical protein FQN52_002054 [Onygenales sp. PD_12]